MTRVTTDGLEMRDRCPALTSVMWAPARWAMNVSSAGGMTWSAVPITAQDGMVFQAGGPDGSVNALAASGRWVAMAFSLPMAPLSRLPAGSPPWESLVGPWGHWRSHRCRALTVAAVLR